MIVFFQLNIDQKMKKNDLQKIQKQVFNDKNKNDLENLANFWV